MYLFESLKVLHQNVKPFPTQPIIAAIKEHGRNWATATQIALAAEFSMRLQLFLPIYFS